MKITVIDPCGRQWVVDALPEFTIDILKQMALSHFNNPVDCVKLAEKYKLVLVSQGRALPDEGTLRDEKLQDNDILLLLKRHLHTKTMNEILQEQDAKSQGPTEMEILEATGDLPVKNFQLRVNDNNTVMDFHTELRKILISLVEFQERLLRYHPEVRPIFQDMQDLPDSGDDSDVDQTALKQLADMGFSAEKAKRALRLNRMSPMEAMDWLLAHELQMENSSSVSTVTHPVCTLLKEKSSDGQLAEGTSTSDGSSSKASTSSEAVSNTTSSSSSSSSCSSSSPSSSSSSLSHSTASHPSKSKVVPMMMRCFRAYKRKNFKPNTKALKNLREMGFSEKEVLDALWINSNNQDAACEWLLGDHHLKHLHFDQGLDPEGPIYKSVMTNPVVQLGLTNPKTLFAFLHMLENPNTTGRWLNDPDTAPLLNQIFRIYHAEKHTLQLSRPYAP